MTPTPADVTRAEAAAARRRAVAENPELALSDPPAPSRALARWCYGLVALGCVIALARLFL